MFKVHDLVCVVDAIDRDVCDVSPFIGRRGFVEHLDYACGCGQTYPDDPMIGVKFAGDVHEEFWSVARANLKGYVPGPKEAEFDGGWLENTANRTRIQLDERLEDSPDLLMGDDRCNMVAITYTGFVEGIGYARISGSSVVLIVQAKCGEGR